MSLSVNDEATAPSPTSTRARDLIVLRGAAGDSSADLVTTSQQHGPAAPSLRQQPRARTHVRNRLPTHSAPRPSTSPLAWLRSGRTEGGSCSRERTPSYDSAAPSTPAALRT